MYFDKFQAVKVSFCQISTVWNMCKGILQKTAYFMTCGKKVGGPLNFRKKMKFGQIFIGVGKKIIQYAAFTLRQRFLPFFYVKSWSNLKPNDSFEICSSRGFQNTPYMLNLMNFWLRYLRLKTIDTFIKLILFHLFHCQFSPLFLHWI